jgi:hypothetical protein
LDPSWIFWGPKKPSSWKKNVWEAAVLRLNIKK